MELRFRTGSGVVAMLLACHGGAQTANSNPVLRTATHLVELRVTVTGAHGRRIQGLRRDQFEVFDGLAKQPAAFFIEHASTLAPPQLPGVFTNTPGILSDGAMPPITVILLDALNTPFGEQSAAQQALRNFLQDSTQRRAVALYALDNSLSLLADFTTDREALIRALDAHNPAETLNRVASSPHPNATGHTVAPIDFFEDMRTAIEARYYMPVRRVAPTLGALQAIADRIARIPGRKNLIWITGGLPFSFTSLPRQLNAADIAVYPVSTSGVASLDLGMDVTISPLRPGWTDTLFPDFRLLEGLGQIADWTGGMLSTSNDLTDQLRSAFQDSAADYQIAFYAPRWDGKFHEVRVKVRCPGAKARARRGYYAIDEPALDPDSQLRLARLSANDSMQIPITVAAVKQLSPHPTVTTKVFLPGSAVAFERTGEQWSARLRLVFVQINDFGHNILESERELAVKLSPATYSEAAATGLRLTTPVAMRDGAGKLRVLLQDRSSGAVGSVTMPISQIPETP